MSMLGGDENLRSTEIPTNAAGYPISLCRGCQAEVFWAETLAGRRQIINSEPSPNGNIAIEERDTLGHRLIAHVFAGDALVSMRNRGEKLYLDHHATCPKAGEFR